jgi:hypothetical protein
MARGSGHAARGRGVATNGPSRTRSGKAYALSAQGYEIVETRRGAVVRPVRGTVYRARGGRVTVPVNIPQPPPLPGYWYYQQYYSGISEFSANNIIDVASEYYATDIFEYAGGEITQEYMVFEQELDVLRGDRSVRTRLFGARFREMLQSLRHGYALDFRNNNPGLSLSGITVREIRDAILSLGLPLNEYFISGTGYDCTVGSANNFRCRLKEFRHIGMVELTFPQAETYDFDGEELLAWVKQYRRESLESDLTTWILYGAISVHRSLAFPPFAFSRYYTAGFDRLLPFSKTIPVTTSYGKSYEIYIPGGTENCIHAAIKWGLAKFYTQSQIQACEEEGLTYDDLFQSMKDELDSTFDDIVKAFEDDYIATRLASSQGTIAKRGLGPTRNKIIAEYKNLVKSGYSSVLLKRLLFHLKSKENIIVRVGSYAQTGGVQRLWSEYDEVVSTLANGLASSYCAFLRVSVNGSIIVTGANGISDLDGSMLAHAVAIFPPPIEQGDQLSLLFSELEARIKVHFDEFKTHSSSNSLTCDSASMLPVLIQCQNDRKTELLEQAARRKAASAVVKSNIRSGKFTKKTYVIAFDIETVENIRGVQNSSIVWEPFVVNKPENLPDNIDANSYTVPQAQIPYTLQWGWVDMRYTAVSPFITGGVKIEYGQNLLGKCVSDFQDNVKSEVLAMTRGVGKAKIFCYAHNASGFDAYIMKCYNYKYPVKRILHTPRGILSISFDLGYGIEMIIRDTKVFFAASLAELCKVFKVPEQYCKTDFPITKIHARNYCHPPIVAAVKEYMENDVYSLACIVHGISATIHKMTSGASLSDPNPPPLYENEAPPITQYVTLMTMVKKGQQKLFSKTLKIPQPLPVDIGALRKYIQHANIGGRVTAYWRGYASARVKDIMTAFTDNRADVLSDIYKELVGKGAYMKVLDVTSLYPHTMSSFPMPCVSTNPIKLLSPQECMEVIDGLACEDCELAWSLCANCKFGGDKDLMRLGFCFILLKNVEPPSNPWANLPDDSPPSNLVPRKLYGGGLVYSYESTASLLERAGGAKAGSTPEVQCFTHYDVYWMKRSGYTFEIMNGFQMDTSYAFRDYILDLFKMRIEAKRYERDNGLSKVVSTFCKLRYNGGYGVNAQKDITSTMVVTDCSDEGELRSKRVIKPDELVCREVCYSHRMPNNQWVLKVEKSPYSCEYFADQSPNHIGAAVVATSRHYMNLAMARVQENGCKCSYTDTDSMCIYGDVYEKVMPKAIYDESADAPMGTYKNDHEEGDNEIVVLSFIIGKKVKLHMTLDAKGKLRFYPTFKGYNPSPIDYESGVHLDVEAIEELRVNALSHIFFYGNMPGTTQTEFKRSMTSGVHIDRNAKFSAESRTFFEDQADGGLLMRLLDSGDYVEKLVPRGAGAPDKANQRIGTLKGETMLRPKFCSYKEADMVRTTVFERGPFWEEAVGGKESWKNFVKLYYDRALNRSAGKPLVEAMSGVTISSEDALLKLFAEGPQVTENDLVWQ